MEAMFLSRAMGSQILCFQGDRIPGNTCGKMEANARETERKKLIVESSAACKVGTRSLPLADWTAGVLASRSRSLILLFPRCRSSKFSTALLAATRNTLSPI